MNQMKINSIFEKDCQTTTPSFKINYETVCKANFLLKRLDFSSLYQSLYLANNIRIILPNKILYLLNCHGGTHSVTISREHHNKLGACKGSGTSTPKSNLPTLDSTHIPPLHQSKDLLPHSGHQQSVYQQEDHVPLQPLP